MMNPAHRPIYLEIVEQPKQRGMRFRYECEGRSAGSIPGENTTADKKTWPSCQIMNYQGVAIMRVSLVNKDDPPKPHPHSLVGRDCNNGVCQVNVDPGNQMLGVFPNLGIQCVRRKEVTTAIRQRLELGINPFGAAIDGDERSAVDVDLNIVRLCFEAFLPDRDGNYTHKLTPVVSNPIYDKKATCSSVLKICRVDKTHGSVQGNEEIFLLCDKVQKEDIQVVFAHKGWEAVGSFASADVHRQVAIVFRTPAYKDENIVEKVEVEFMLRRPSDMQTSPPITFTYLPKKHDVPTTSKLPSLLTRALGQSDLRRKSIRNFIENRTKNTRQRIPTDNYSSSQRNIFTRQNPSQYAQMPSSSSMKFTLPSTAWSSQPESKPHIFASAVPSNMAMNASTSVKQEVNFNSFAAEEWSYSNKNFPFPSHQPNTVINPISNDMEILNTTSQLPDLGATASLTEVLNEGFENIGVEAMTEVPVLNNEANINAARTMGDLNEVPKFDSFSDLLANDDELLDLNVHMQHCSIEKEVQPQPQLHQPNIPNESTSMILNENHEYNHQVNLPHANFSPMFSSNQRFHDFQSSVTPHYHQNTHPSSTAFQNSDLMFSRQVLSPEQSSHHHIFSPSRTVPENQQHFTRFQQPNLNHYSMNNTNNNQQPF